MWESDPRAHAWECQLPEEEFMPEEKLNGMRVAILATDFFEEAELVEPRKALEQAGARTQVISPKDGEIQGLKHVEKGKKVAVDLNLQQARPEDFDAVLIPGGALNADALRVEKKVA
jgi:protease I